MASFLDLTTGLPALWAKIKGLITQSDWEEDDTTKSSHVLNRPAIRAGEGENSVLIGQIEQDESAKEFHLTFDYPTTTTNTVTFTTEDDLSEINWDSTKLARSVCNLLYTYSFSTTSFQGNIWRNVKNIDVINNTITFDTTLSRTSGYSYTTVNTTLYYYCKVAKGSGGAIAEGMVTYSVGKSSHAEGRYTKALNNYSHAEGYQTTASGMYSHTEGSGTSALQYASHAEGSNTTASGSYSHAEGASTTASGSYSHTEGSNTIASSNYQHVQGKYNIEDANSIYAEIVGNGTSSTRSNARTLDWSGNEVLAGKLTVGAAPTNEMDVATKQYVDSATAGITTNLAGLTDTTIASPSDGQVLTYDSTSSKWVNADPTGTTYSLSLSGSTITLTGSDGSTSSINLPIYDGSVTEVWQGGVY